jgi:signal peptidase
MTVVDRDHRSPAHASAETTGRADTGRRADDRPPRKSAAMRAVDLLLTVAAIGGVVCIAAVIAATVFDITLIMFKTGSMSPTIPAGSLAVVREIPATEARVGDIVTIDRPDELPITHRVVSTSSTTDGRTSIVMKGDANELEDPAPYVVDTVRIVLYSVPGLASVIVWMSHPFVLGGITLGAALLVTWAFWPRGQRRRHRAARAARGAGGAAVAALALVVVPIVAAPQAARADSPDSTIVRGKYLVLESIANRDDMESLTPGRPVPWQVGVSVNAPDPGLVRLGISAAGALARPGALDVEIRECAEQWVGGVCATGESLWLAQQDLASATVATNENGSREIGSMRSTDTVWLQVAVILPAEAPPGTDATIAIHAWGGTDAATIDTASEGFLASTGTESPIPALALAVAAVFAGLTLAGVAQLTKLIGRRTEEAASEGPGNE